MTEYCIITGWVLVTAVVGILGVRGMGRRGDIVGLVRRRLFLSRTITTIGAAIVVWILGQGLVNTVQGEERLLDRLLFVGLWVAACGMVNGLDGILSAAAINIAMRGQPAVSPVPASRLMRRRTRKLVRRWRCVHAVMCRVAGASLSRVVRKSCSRHADGQGSPNAAR
jgi:hypothetical protein